MLNSSSCLKHYNHLFTQIDTCESTSAIHWTVRSWNETKTSTIESCFRDTDFPVNAWLSAETEDQDDDILLNELASVPTVTNSSIVDNICCPSRVQYFLSLSTFSLCRHNSFLDQVKE
jgi:hypothetical protein